MTLHRTACLAGLVLAPLATVAAGAEVERGRALASQYQCGACHEIPGVRAARGRLAVSLAGFGGRSYIAGRLPNDPALLARWIADPRALVPDTAMPSMGVSDADARAIAAYLRSLK